MQCLVGVFAMFGLGWLGWLAPDIPGPVGDRAGLLGGPQKHAIGSIQSAKATAGPSIVNIPLSDPVETWA